MIQAGGQYHHTKMKQLYDVSSVESATATTSLGGSFVGEVGWNDWFYETQT